MLTAIDARQKAKKFEEEQKSLILENLMENVDNKIALEIFEEEIDSLATKGNSILYINETKKELLNLIETTDIKTILKFLGYLIIKEDNIYKIMW